MARITDGQKRKAVDHPNGSPSKRRSTGVVRVKHRRTEVTTKPVIVSSPGTSLPSFLEFRAYVTSKEDSSEDLLHASNHPSLNYTATGADADGQSIDHDRPYVAIYDPEAGRLDITEVKDVAVRGLVAEEPSSRESSEDGEPKEPASQIARRQALTESFGTKKSKRMQQERTMNLTFKTANPESTDSLSNAILASIPIDPSPNTAAGEAISTTDIMLSTKPFPKPDLSADIHHIYALSKLVIPGPFTETLFSMPTDSWLETISNESIVQCTSRYVANRVARVARDAFVTPSDNNKAILQVLRYILLLIEFSRLIRPGRTLGPPSSWNTPKQTKIADYSLIPFKVHSTLAKHYSTDPSLSPVKTDPSSPPPFQTPTSSSGPLIPTKSSLTLLHTTILALTLHIPPPSGKFPVGALVTDPTDIAQDLHLDPHKAREYFRQLGCRCGRVSVAELKGWGMEERGTGGKEGRKSEGQYVRLVLPLEFPAAKKGMPSKGRRGGR